MNRLLLFKGGLAVLLAMPLTWLSWQVLQEVQQPGSALGADPGEAVVHFLGEWSLRMLLFAFSVTPLRLLFSRLTLTRATLGLLFSRVRRMTGLFAFTYVALHLLAYVALYLLFEWQALLQDFVERPYITVGLGAFVGLFLMAVTSTRGWQRRLRANWQRLHKVVYLCITLSLVHLWWLTKDGYAELFVYTLWFVCLIAVRGQLIWRPLTSRA